VARRILLLITDLEIGGTPTVVRELAARLHDPAHGVHVEVACLSKWGPVADQIRDAGVTVTALGATRSRQLPGVVRRLRHLVRDHSIDSVFSFLVHANVAAALASRRLPGVRFLQSIQTIQPRPRWHWLAQRWAHRRAEKIVVPSRAIVDAAERRSAIPRSRVVVIPNAVDPDAFPRVEVFAGPRIRAGYLGRLDSAKDPGMLIKALHFAAMEEAELHYFGDGPARASMDGDAAWWKSNWSEVVGRVVFHGAVTRPQDALSRMDVLWMPSAVEGFGLVLIEAMASGVPVVATGTGGVLDVVTDGENGLLADDPVWGYRTFAASLWKLRDDPGFRKQLIENGLRTVREKFTWEVVLPKYRELLQLPS
jgi:glycosyltransferase involved in cell wall biosynthesis